MTEQKATPNGDTTLAPHWIAFWTALLYAFGVLIVGGGAGIWLPEAMPSKTVTIDALTTFVMATLAPIFADLLLDAEIYGRRLSKFWRTLLVAACFLAGALAITALVRENAKGDWASGVLSSILSIAIWMAVAIKTERFLPIGSDKGSIGGEKPSADRLAGGGL